MKSKLAILWLGIFWGAIIALFVEQVGEKSSEHIVTSIDVLQVILFLVGISVVAILTYKELKE